MKKLKNIVTFVIIPILIIILLYINASLQAAKYQDSTSKLNQYGAEITTNRELIKGKPNELIKVPLNIKNTGTMAWLKDDKNSINLSYHIFDINNEIIVYDGERTNLTKSVRSGEEIKLNGIVKMPEKPGKYKIEFDMVHEGVTWFKDKGSKTLSIKLEVE
ncbi:hypothetical protein [Thermohalobacter berrensis]|uniref:Intracellular proteinase inhibitor BsuPI domain-containing protein n=1 Tax=Thermohalobacter berrensis TaxID=99594 RepID=A0A419T491_9FIRM|nr:hypothetical protein [Thermohalobacter berrensis]RKD32281.1 hypothetical protein BET03_02925 [Thermohalobacter berrensis]